jgi:hypothetical protein
LINHIVIGEETDIGPDGSYVSHLALYLRAMRDVGASTRQFERFRTLALVGVPVDVALGQIGAPRHVQAYVAHTMALANSGSTEELLAAFFYGREDIIPEMFRRLLNTLYDAKHDSDRFRHFSTTSSQLVLPCSASHSIDPTAHSVRMDEGTRRRLASSASCR